MVLLEVKKEERVERRRRKKDAEDGEPGTDAYLGDDSGNGALGSPTGGDGKALHVHRIVSSGDTSNERIGHHLRGNPHSSSSSLKRYDGVLHSRRSSNSECSSLPSGLRLKSRGRNDDVSSPQSSSPRRTSQSNNEGNSRVTSPTESDCSLDDGLGEEFADEDDHMIEEDEKEYPQDWLRSTPLMKHDTPTCVPEVLAGKQDPRHVEAFMREFALLFALQYHKPLQTTTMNLDAADDSAERPVILSELDLFMWSLFQYQARRPKGGTPMHATQQATSTIR